MEHRVSRGVESHPFRHLNFSPGSVILLPMKQHQLDVDFDNDSPWAKLITDTCERASMHGIQVRMLADPFIMGKYNGQFNEDDPENPFLEVACGKPINEWGAVFLHESCHMDQCIEKVPAWTNQMVTPEYDSMTFLTFWMDGLVELNPKQLEDYIRRSLTVEWDCERRSLEKMKGYDLPINSMEYAQKANSYIWFYRCWLMEKRRWYKPGQEPWNNRKIWPKLAGFLHPTAGGYMDPPSAVQRLYDENLA